MKKRFFYTLFGSVIAMLASSCSTTEYRPTDNNCQFVIKKIEGKRKWALAENTQENRQLYTEFEYDSIFSAEAEPYRIKQLFIGIKDGKYYGITSWAKKLFDGEGFTSLVSVHQGPRHSASIYGPLFNEAKVSEGYRFFYKSKTLFEFGPAEYLFESYSSLIYKKNGKWGAVLESDRSQVIPCLYDGIIEIKGHDHYFLVKKGNSWSALDKKGRVMRKSRSIINHHLNLPILTYAEYKAGEHGMTYRRIGTEDVGQITINPFESPYVTF